jgi:hypothetical protein
VSSSITSAALLLNFCALVPRGTRCPELARTPPLDPTHGPVSFRVVLIFSEKKPAGPLSLDF